MNNFYLIDKPLGISSFDIIRQLRKKLNIRKIGHTGTLDPLATGGVILATGNYTKLIPYLEKDKKTYEFTINIDGVTDSFDLAEEVEYLDKDIQEKYKKEITKEKLEKILTQNFSGKIVQIPPKYSAIKINGKRAYKLAREGKEVEIKSREIEIYNIELLSYKYPEIKLRAEVSAGTYIRSIAADLGNILGTGGYITKLRRTKIGYLDIKNAQNLESFDKSNNININELFKNEFFVKIDKDILSKLNNGLKIKGNFNYKENKDLFVIFEGKIINIIIYDGEKLIPKKKI